MSRRATGRTCLPSCLRTWSESTGSVSLFSSTDSWLPVGMVRQFAFRYRWQAGVLCLALLFVGRSNDTSVDVLLHLLSIWHLTIIIPGQEAARTTWGNPQKITHNFFLRYGLSQEPLILEESSSHLCEGATLGSITAARLESIWIFLVHNVLVNQSSSQVFRGSMKLGLSCLVSGEVKR